MKSTELRQKFLDFFEKRGHTIIPSASLIPDEIGLDQKTLFVTAGMQPLVPFLLGQSHPAGKRLVDVQKCIRTGDIDEVGDDTHLTFFEMLGNWSLGDYWKQESIQWSFEFLTRELQIPKERLAVSCFVGDQNAPKDEQSADIWRSLGVDPQRIAFLPKEDNWWGPVGDFGPCGPDTEIFYWKSTTIPAPEIFDPSDKNWVEIWNNVFMQYIKDASGNYVLAEQKNVDTGMGLERTLAILNGCENVYETDLFLPIIQKIEQLTGKRYQDHAREFRIIADHIRAAVFMVADGVVPSNTSRGYVLRRLLRKVMYLFNKELPVSGASNLYPLINEMVLMYQKTYKNIFDRLDIIRHTIEEEELQFEKTRERGQKEFERGVDPFILFTTYGFPIELTADLAKEKGQKINREDFEEKMKQHQELSRTASAGMFKGGLADHQPQTIRLHTAHHLLLAALQELFGKQVKQRGSNINSERLRIDFSFDRKLTDEEKKKLEEIVNQKIQQGLQVVKREMPIEEAEKIGAEMEFGVKYGNTVSVYFIEDKNGNIVSKEFCGGPHVVNTSELGKFKILKEEASSQGVRRIKAKLE